MTQVDESDRYHVVVNVANVCHKYFEATRKPINGKKPYGWDWKGVEEINGHCQRRGLNAGFIVHQNSMNRNPPPQRIFDTVDFIEAPSSDKSGKGVDDLFTLRTAMTNNAWYIDNDNYRDWKREMRDGKHEDLARWCSAEGKDKHVQYSFQPNGRFQPDQPLHR